MISCQFCTGIVKRVNSIAYLEFFPRIFYYFVILNINTILDGTVNRTQKLDAMIQRYGGRSHQIRHILHATDNTQDSLPTISAKADSSCFDLVMTK